MRYFTALLVLFVAQSGFSESRLESITSSRDWRAEIVVDHRLHGRKACLASTRKGVLRLEVYAEEMENGGFTEPTVQITANGRFPKFHRAKMRFNSGQMFRLTLARVEGQGSRMQALISRFEDREEIIRLLKAVSTATVDFYNTRGSKVSSNRFSLRGSSRTISGQFDHCGLEIDNIEL